MRRGAAADASATSIPSACRCSSTRPTRCIVTSDREGFGLAVLEALACDVPVLADAMRHRPRGARRRRRAPTADRSSSLAGEPTLEAILAAGDRQFAGRAAARATRRSPWPARARGAWRQPRRRELSASGPRRVPVVEHQRVAVGVGEERHVTDAGVERVAEERTPRFSSSTARASMSSTCSAIAAGFGTNSRPIDSGTITVNVRFPVSNSAK